MNILGASRHKRDGILLQNKPQNLLSAQHLSYLTRTESMTDNRSAGSSVERFKFKPRQFAFVVFGVLGFFAFQ